MDEKNILISLENLKNYNEELFKRIPKEQIWVGEGIPSDTTDEQIFGINTTEGKIYYKKDGKWNPIVAGGSGEIIKSIIDITRISNESSIISPETEKYEISFSWTCTVGNTSIRDKGLITISVNNVEKESFKEATGVITRDVKKYLTPGENTIVITIEDSYGSKEEIIFYVNIVALTLTATGYKPNTIISLKKLEENNTNGIGLNVTVTGTVTKTLHMKIDGVEYDFGGTLPTLAAGKKTITIYIPKQEHGSHLIELYATHTVLEENGEEEIIYSNSVFYDTIWQDDITPLSKAIIASSYGNTKANQYELLKIPYFLYKSGYNSCDIRFGIKKDGVIGYINQIPQKRETQKEFEWQISSDDFGQISFIIEAGTYNSETQEFTIEDTREFSFLLEPQEIPVIPNNTSALSIDFKAEQTDNFGEDKDVWQSKSNEIANLKANFVENTFDWINNGWELRDGRPALKIANGAKLEIPYAIFNQSDIAGTTTDFSTQGVTIEIDVSFDEISNSNLDFFTCFDESNKKGIKISPTRALLTDGQNSVQVQYSSSESKKYNNSMRFTFLICPLQNRYKADGSINDTLGSMFIYINGIGAAASEYKGSNFKHSNLPYFNPEGCSVHLHSFKMYRRNLEPIEILQSWIYDMKPEDKINAYQKNNVYDGEEKISYTEVIKQIPCITIIGNLPTYKGDKKYPFIKFSGTENNLYDFTIKEVELDVQGTSSQYYPVKNWKFKSKYKKDGKTIEQTFDMVNGDKLTKYALADDQIPDRTFCLKADYMETSSTHNTVTANFANSMYDEKTPPQKPKNNNEAEIERAEKTRTTIYGRPILVFYQDTIDSPLRFGGKYNFNYDKGAEDVFGFFEDSDYEVIDCVEFRENRNDRCLLKVSDYSEIAKNLTAADLDEFDKKSWITNADGTVTSAYEWGRSFEFRYYYHRDETKETKPYEYLKPATDWIVETDFSKADPNKTLEPAYITDKGIANFLYDKNLNVVKFLDQNGNERRALDLGYSNPDELDYDVELIKTYITNENGEQEEVSYYALAWDNDLGKEVYKFIKDTENYRLTKFKNELPEHFNEHFCLMYFELMEMNGMIDSSTKNMFWATWGERHSKHPIESGDKVVIWYPIFYDMDTMMGINNTGKMNIPYNVEFDSPLEGSETGYAYNGYDNVFWNNFRRAYANELNSTFRDKISDGTFSLENMLNLYESHSENFSEAIYNADGQLKIIDSYFDGYKTNEGEKFPDWLHVYQGDRYYYRRFWLPNRFNYLLSKNFAGDYANDFISMRLNDPRTSVENQGKDIEVDYAFDIITWKDQYTRIKYGGRSVTKRCLTDEEITIEAPGASYNDTETAIFGASNLKSIGKLANKYASTLELSAARNLLEIDVGSDDPNYNNLGLNSITFGSNSMLRKVNVQNCKGLNSSLGLTACSNIKEVNARGTNITGVELPQKGVLEKLYLPNTVKNLTLTNQPNLKNFELPTTIVAYKETDENGEEQEKIKEIYNIEVLKIENTPITNTKDLVEKSINEKLQRLSLKGVDWTRENKLQDDKLLFLIKQKGEENTLNGETVNDEPILEGDFQVVKMKKYLIDRLNTYFNGGAYAPDLKDRKFRLTVEQPVETYTVIFKNEGVKINSGIIDDQVVVEETINYQGSIPTKPEEWDREYQFISWRTIENGEEKYYTTEQLLNKKVYFDMEFEAVYQIIYKQFTFNFWRDDVIQHTEVITTNSEPTKAFSYEHDETTDYDFAIRFVGWHELGSEDIVIKKDGYINIPENQWVYKYDYYPTFSSDRKYRVSFIDYNNAVLVDEKIYYLDNLVELPNPTLEYSDPTYIYNFSNWISDKNTKVESNEELRITQELFGENNYKLVFTPEYSLTYIDYIINFWYINGGLENNATEYNKVITRTLHYGDSIILPTEEEVQNLEIEGYHFTGKWKNSENEIITPNTGVLGNRDYYVDYEINKYTIQYAYFSTNDFELKGNSEVVVEENVPYGTILTYGNQYGPPIDINSQYQTIDKIWTCIGWSPNLKVVEEDAEYGATYTSTPRSYKISFIGYTDFEGNNEEKVEYTLNYGTDLTPYIPQIEREGYDFVGWDKSIVAVNGEATYTAQYSIKTYTITWTLTGSSATTTCEYGKIPTPPNGYNVGDSLVIEGATYKITGWTPTLTEATGNTTYSALASVTGRKVSARFTRATYNYSGGSDFDNNSSNFLNGTGDFGNSPIARMYAYGLNFEVLRGAKNLKITELEVSGTGISNSSLSETKVTLRFIRDFGYSSGEYTDLGDGAVTLVSGLKNTSKAYRLTKSSFPNTFAWINDNIDKFLNGYTTNSFGAEIRVNSSSKGSTTPITITITCDYDV